MFIIMILLSSLLSLMMFRKKRIIQQRVLIVLLQVVVLLQITRTNNNNFVVHAYLFKNDPQIAAIVKEYTGYNNNKDDFQLSTKPRVVNFYQPSCSHCQVFKVDYVHVAKQMYQYVEFYAVSCEEHHDLCKNYEIQGFPTVYAIRGGGGDENNLHDDSWIKNAIKLNIQNFTRATVNDALGITTTSILPMTANNNKQNALLGVVRQNPTTIIKSNQDFIQQEGQQQMDQQQQQHLPPPQLLQNQQLRQQQLIKKQKELMQQQQLRHQQLQEVIQQQQQQQLQQREENSINDHNNNNNNENESPTSEDDYDNYKKADEEGIKVMKDQTKIVDEYSGSEMDGKLIIDRNEVDEEVEDIYPEEMERREDESEEGLYRSPGIVGGDNSVVAEMSIRNMDKWKELLKDQITKHEMRLMNMKKPKEQLVFLQAKLKQATSGATDIMKANRVGTKEFIERRHKIKSKLLGFKKVKKMDNSIFKKYRKKVRKTKLVERIPVLNQFAHSISYEEELIWDASLAFLNSLKIGVYNNNSNLPLRMKQKDSLINWLELMSISLPPEWSIHETIGDLRDNIDFISQSQSNLHKILNQHKFPRTNYSKSCKYDAGFHCAFWKLLHVMTMGVAIHRGGQDLIDTGMARKDATIFSPLKAADTVREYMSYFFDCTDCSNHFIAQYDVCENNRRCNRLSGETMYASDDNWKELAKWLWEVHNDISVRVLNENKQNNNRDSSEQKGSMLNDPGVGPGPATLEEEIAVLWPSVSDCFACFRDDGVYNEDAIFVYLEHTYWPGHDLEETPQSLLWFVEDETSGGMKFTLILLFISLGALAIMGKTISKTSVQNTMIKAKTLGTKAGSKKKYERSD